MKKLFTLMLLGILLLSITNIGTAQNIKTNLKHMRGDTTYIIQGEQGEGWKSKLEFPLNVNLIELTYSKPLKNNTDLNFAIAHNPFDEDAGTFKDSDWYYSISQDEKYIYSESDAELDALIFDINLVTLYDSRSISSKRNTNYQFKVGYKQQEFDFAVYDLVQESDYNSGLNTTVDGKVLEYEVTYEIPYVGIIIGSTNNSKTTSWNLDLSYSPFVQADDYDDHILRDKVAESDTEGSALMLATNFTHKLKDNFNLVGQISYTDIDTDGTQVQKDYSGNVLYEDIDAEIKSEQLSASIGLKYKF